MHRVVVGPEHVLPAQHRWRVPVDPQVLRDVVRRRDAVDRQQDTKTRESRRTLALPGRCVTALTAQRTRQTSTRVAARDRWADLDPVFVSETGIPLDAANVRRGFRRIAEAVGLDAARWTPRELRHSFVSLLSKDEVPLEQISRLVGCSGTSVTQLVYRKQIRPVLDDGATSWTASSGTRRRSHAVGHSATPDTTNGLAGCSSWSL